LSKDQEEPTKPTPRKEPKRSQNVEEAIQFYSKRWHVTPEEAADKIETALKDRKAPTMDELFPEPLGPMSEKIQDINQSLLNTAATRRKIQEINNPAAKPSGLDEAIGESVKESIGQEVKDRLTRKNPVQDGIDTAIGSFVKKAIEDKLEGTKDGDMRAMFDSLLDEWSEKMIKPLYDKVEAIQAANGNKGQDKHSTSISEAAELVITEQEKMKKFLEDRGFKVESVSIDKATVEKMINEAVTKENERFTQEKDKWERETGSQVQLESERIKATENILTNVSDRVMEYFLDPLKKSIQEAIEKGAFRGRPTPPPSGQ
jgi:hypothetical protein